MTNWSAGNADLLSLLGLSTIVAVFLSLGQGQAIAFLGIFFLLFCPGYAFIGILFPAPRSIPPLERIGLSFGTSLVLVPLLGIALNIIPFGLRTAAPVLLTLVVLLTAIAMYRRRVEGRDPLWAAEFRAVRHRIGAGVRPQPPASLLLTAGILIVSLVLIGNVGRFLVSPKVMEAFTEFYVAQETDQGVQIPDLRLGPVPLTIVVVNQESREVSYRVRVALGETELNTFGPLLLSDGERWEEALIVPLQPVNQEQRLQFELYRDGSPEIYRWLNLRVGGGRTSP